MRRILLIVKKGTYEAFEDYELLANDTGDIVRMAWGLLESNPEAWKVMVFDIDKKREIATITA